MIFRCVKQRLSRGSVLVEFVLVAQIFIVLLLGAIEVGWVLYVQNTMVDGARLGARVAVIDSSASEATITTSLTDYLETSGVNTENLEVVIDPLPISAQTQGAPITVTLRLPYDSNVSILPAPLFLSG